MLNNIPSKLLISPLAHLQGHPVDVPDAWNALQRGAAPAWEQSWVLRQSISDPSLFDNASENTQMTLHSCSSLKLTASSHSLGCKFTYHHYLQVINLPHLPKARDAKWSLFSKTALPVAKTDAPQNNTKWAVERRLLWVGPCMQYIRLLIVET